MSDDPVALAERIVERSHHWQGDPDRVTLANAFLTSEAARKVAEERADKWQLRSDTHEDALDVMRQRAEKAEQRCARIKALGL